MKMKRRMVALLGATLLALSMLAGPAAAHILEVDPPGQEDPIWVWVGGPTLPEQAQGQGLVPNPFGLQPPSHTTGLNTACHTLREHGHSVVDIFGPPTPAGCPHGT